MLTLNEDDLQDTALVKGSSAWLRPHAHSLTDAAADSIRMMIINGLLAPGERVLQDRLAKELGISRQPVRAALQRLQAEGLVSGLSNGRLIIREYTQREIYENYVLRRDLEGLAAGVAAEARTESDVEFLQQVNERMLASTEMGEPTQFLELNRLFHSRIAKMSNLGTLQNFLQALWVGVPIATPLSVPGRAKSSIQEHSDVINAIRSGDAAGASRAMRTHIEHAARDFGNTIQAQPDAESLRHRLGVESI